MVISSSTPHPVSGLSAPRLRSPVWYLCHARPLDLTLRLQSERSKSSIWSVLDRQGHPGLILVPNRVDVRTLEGRQIVDELTGFGEIVGPTIGDRSAFVRAFSTGQSVAEMPEGQVAHREIQLLCDSSKNA